MNDVIAQFIRRSIHAYREGDYEPIFGQAYMSYVRSTDIDDVAREVLSNDEYLRPLRIAFGHFTPLEDEVYLYALDESSVLTSRRLFLIEGEALLRPPIDLANIDSYKESGFWRKREIIQLVDGEHIERKTDAVIDAAVMQIVVRRAIRATTEASAKPMSLDELRWLHGRALRRLRAAVKAAKSPDTWSAHALRWIEEMIEFIDGTSGSPLEQPHLPEWRYPLAISARHGPEKEELEREVEFAALRFSAEWANLGLGVSKAPGDDSGDSADKAQMALLHLIGFVTQRIGDDMNAALQDHARDVAANSAERAGRVSNENEAAFPDFAALFMDRMQAHRKRMLASGHPDHSAIESILADDTLAEMAGLAAGKVAQSWSDGTPHSVLLADEHAAKVVMTFRGSVLAAATWYGSQWNGYVRMLEHYLSSDAVRGHSTGALCHITFGIDGTNAWVNVSLLAVDGQAFRQVPILATDLMSDIDLDSLKDKFR